MKIAVFKNTEITPVSHDTVYWVSVGDSSTADMTEDELQELRIPFELEPVLIDFSVANSYFVNQDLP